MKKQTDAGCPSHQGLRRILHLQPGLLGLCPATGMQKQQKCFDFSFLKKVLQPDPTYAHTTRSGEGEMRACAGNFLTSVNFSQALAMSQCDAL